MTVHYPHDFYVWYLDHSTREITEQVYLEDGTLLTANYPADLEWVLLPQFDTIMGLPVQKAEARTSYGEGFMELTLEPAYAWFTTGIPISTGPERHYGLPGLIVKLEYRNAKRFTFTLTDIEFKPFDRPIPIAPDKGIVVNKEEAIRPHTIKQKWLRQQKKLLDSQ
jgi:GLPGLI family protein